jgi:hypothetical protein
MDWAIFYQILDRNLSYTEYLEKGEMVEWHLISLNVHNRGILTNVTPIYPLGVKQIGRR